MVRGVFDGRDHDERAAVMQPRVTTEGVPMCSDDCPEHDGKRCKLQGLRPDSICEPYVETMATDIVKLKNKVRDLSQALNPK